MNGFKIMIPSKKNFDTFWYHLLLIWRSYLSHRGMIVWRPSFIMKYHRSHVKRLKILGKSCMKVEANNFLIFNEFHELRLRSSAQLWFFLNTFLFQVFFIFDFYIIFIAEELIYFYVKVRIYHHIDTTLRSLIFLCK